MTGIRCGGRIAIRKNASVVQVIMISLRSPRRAAGPSGLGPCPRASVQPQAHLVAQGARSRPSRHIEIIWFLGFTRRELEREFDDGTRCPRQEHPPVALAGTCGSDLTVGGDRPVHAATAIRTAGPRRPTGATIPNSARCARMELMMAVCWRMNRCRVRWRLKQLAARGSWSAQTACLASLRLRKSLPRQPHRCHEPEKLTSRYRDRRS